MANKTKKQTPQDRYAAILAERGEKMDNCTVLAFVFTERGSAKNFHYSLMQAEPRVPYLIFDLSGEMTGRVQVVVRNKDNIEGRIRAIAEIHKGRRTMPDL